MNFSLNLPPGSGVLLQIKVLLTWTLFPSHSPEHKQESLCLVRGCSPKLLSLSLLNGALLRQSWISYPTFSKAVLETPVLHVCNFSEVQMCMRVESSPLSKLQYLKFIVVNSYFITNKCWFVSGEYCNLKFFKLCFKMNTGRSVTVQFHFSSSLSSFRFSVINIKEQLWSPFDFHMDSNLRVLSKQ